MNKARFSRAALVDELQARIGRARERYFAACGKNYDPLNGWSQVPVGNDAANRAYGEIDALVMVMLEINW